jgi:hypothetical protein
MGLKGDRQETSYDVSFFMNEVAERGGVVTMSTAGSGSALDQAAALVTYAAAPSGKVAVGLLLADMVDIDQTKYHVNFHKNEVQKGGKVPLLTEGWVVTDMIYPGVTPTAGITAYLAHSGLLAITDVIGSNIKVGRFYSTKDEDGFAKVYVKLPQV